MKTIKLSLLTIALLAATGVQAQKAGDTIVGLGWAHISPSASISPPVVTGNSQTLGSTISTLVAGNASLANYTSAQIFGGKLNVASASIDKANTISFSVLHMLTDDFGAELSIGKPPTLHINLVTPNGSEPAIADAAKADALTPAVVAKYFFMNPTSTFRPYLGLGVTHAKFSNITPQSTSPATTVGKLAGLGASMSSSWAPIYNAGVIYNFDEKWSLNASVSYIPLKTDVTLVGSGLSALNPAFAGLGNVTTTTKLTMNPTDYIIRLGYKF